MKTDDVKDLKQLGSNQTLYKYNKPSVKILETFPNQHPEKEYVINMTFPEFTSLCPKTGQPDFATIKVQYVPRKKCLESKSIKLYLFAYREVGSFMETIVNNILNDFVEVCSPKNMVVKGIFNPRGGLKIIVVARTSTNRKKYV
ncbi:MAG: NADPH-dependent 7-cyano-7-deazaguanine reductase [Syntrophomonadaceae bacterium]|nr:NADPH-dependent 7-cyano-7-deazaguanine reductase [Bacillota bacterium]